MGHSGGKITAPVNTYDIKTVLGETSDDVGTLCTSKKINKASKFKPIKYDTPAMLTDAQRAGDVESIGKGIIYGVAFSAPLAFNELAEAGAMRYHAPEAGTDWLRMTDFIGYDHNAIFTPQGVIANKTYFDYSGHKDINVDISEKETSGGINIADVARQLDQTLPSDDPFAKLYPCVLVQAYGGDEDPTGDVAVEGNPMGGTSTKYIRALAFNGSYNPMRVNGVWQGERTAIVDNSAPLFLKSENTKVLCCVFFFKQLTTSSIDLKSKWYPIEVGSATESLPNTIPLEFGRPVLCPNAGCHVIKVQKFYNVTAAFDTAVLGLVSNRYHLQVRIKFSGDPDGRTYTVTASLHEHDSVATIAGGSTDFTYSSAAINVASILVDTGLLMLTGTSYDARYTVKDPNGTTILSGIYQNVPTGFIFYD